MARSSDPLPPASSDGFVQDYLEQHWRDAVRLSHEAMDTLREVWPEFSQHIPETGASALGSALEHHESALASLHRAGRHVLGTEAYERFLEAAAQAKVE